jgi:glycosyltransferase involved in cell wall biosynthesis
VRFLGAVPHAAMGELLARFDVALNLATTGNMDKSGLEALAAGVPLVTTNESFKELGKHAGLELVGRGDPALVADAIVRASTEQVSSVAEIVLREHSLEALIPRILAILAHA